MKLADDCDSKTICMGLDTIKPVFGILQILAVGPDLCCSPFGKITSKLATGKISIF